MAGRMPCASNQWERDLLSAVLSVGTCSRAPSSDRGKRARSRAASRAAAKIVTDDSPSKWLATPLLTALVVIELADAVFAVDSVPAVLAGTDDTLLAFTSNALALLGLRSLFFLLAEIGRASCRERV